jgi:hypothetical protein
MVVIDVAAIGVYGSAQPDWRMTAAAALLTAAAATVAGGVLGLTCSAPRGGRDADGSALEQVGDWLTKIAIGVALTQFGAISAAAGRLFRTLGPMLGDGPGAIAFAGGLVCFTLPAGFLTGWLFGRLLLRPVRLDGDGPAGGGVPAGFGIERATELEQIMVEARRTARSLRLDPDDVGALLRQSTDGQRATALAFMQARQELTDIDALAVVLARPLSGFEHGQALALATQVLPYLAAPDAERLRQAARGGTAEHPAGAAGTHTVQLP